MKNIATPLTVIVLGVAMLFIGYGIGNHESQHSKERDALGFIQNRDSLVNVLQHSLRDYQIEYHFDTMWVYNGSELIGMHLDSGIQHGAFLDSLILKDNE